MTKLGSVVAGQRLRTKVTAVGLSRGLMAFPKDSNPAAIFDRADAGVLVRACEHPKKKHRSLWPLSTSRQTQRFRSGSLRQLVSSGNWSCLKSLGFNSYKAYLASPLWAYVREAVFALKGRTCSLCGQYATQAHHNRYNRKGMMGKKLTHIHPLCRACHEKVEFTRGKKLDLNAAARKFRMMRGGYLSQQKRALKSQ